MRSENHKIEDRILLRKACNEGCTVSLAEIHGMHRLPIFDYLKNKAPDSNTAEDILQEVFRQILEGKCRYDGSSEPKSYLIGVARTLLKKELSRKKAGCSNELLVDLTNLFEDDNCQNPIDRLEELEFRQDLQDGISKLPVELKRAVESIYVEGKTYTEAAKESGCNYDTMRKRIKYAFGRLKKMKFFRP